MTELYKRHRPKTLKAVVGQNETLRMLAQLIKRGSLPHTILFSGPSGTGKTTLARILKDKLKCSDMDFHEMNLADLRGIEEARRIRRNMMLAPLGGDVRIWLLDECHKLTNDAQNALLKVLEDTPSHVYFFLCTTEPQKLLDTVKTRCAQFELKALTLKDLEALIDRTVAAEEKELSPEVREAIAEAAEGSPRKALVLLDQILGLPSEEAQLASIRVGAATSEGIELARALLDGEAWPKICKILKGIEGVDSQAEKLRRMVLGYMSSVALGGGKKSARAVEVIEEFEDHFFDTGKAGLIRAAYRATVRD